MAEEVSLARCEHSRSPFLGVFLSPDLLDGAFILLKIIMSIDSGM